MDRSTTYKPYAEETGSTPKAIKKPPSTSAITDRMSDVQIIHQLLHPQMGIKVQVSLAAD